MWWRVGFMSVFVGTFLALSPFRVHHGSLLVQLPLSIAIMFVVYGGFELFKRRGD